MKLRKENVSEEVWKLYEEVKDNLGDKKLEIKMQKPRTSDLANYNYDGNKYIISINPDKYSDYVFSHELLHVYIGLKNIVPILPSCEEDGEEMSQYLAILLNDTIQHTWIINEQKRRNILGEAEFVKNHLNNLIKLRYKEVGRPSDDFYRIYDLYIFMSDYPEYINELKEALNNKYPSSLSCAEELLREKLKFDITSPFNARKYVINCINKFANWLKENGYPYEFLKREIRVKPVFTESQKEEKAIDVLKIGSKYGKFYLYTIEDNQSCNITDNLELAKQIKVILLKNTLGEALDKLKIAYYIDDTKGNWTCYNR